MVSFVVPAHNEQEYLGRTVGAIHQAAVASGEPYEVIVVNDASTDATAAVARKSGATVIDVDNRQIAATRNAGGFAARGERLIFVDADTVVSPRVVAAALRCLDRGAAGGAAPACFEGPVPLYAPLLMWWFRWLMRVTGLCGGAFMFCTRDAFRATGGFDERLFGAEDAKMAWALGREGRFVVLWPTVLTSGRRMRGALGLRMLGSLLKMAFFPWMLRRRANVEKVWYESSRDRDECDGHPIIVSFVNAVVLLLTVAIITNPLWELIPWSWTPRSSPLGRVRLAAAIISCHAALLLWPCAYHLARNMFGQRRWRERAKLLVLATLCVWLAWSGTQVVVWFWSGLFTGWRE